MGLANLILSQIQEKKYTIKRTPSSTDITPVPLDQARTTYRSQLQTEYADQWSQTTPGSPERDALIIEINEELDRRTLNHFGYEYLVN